MHHSENEGGRTVCVRYRDGESSMFPDLGSVRSVHLTDVQHDCSDPEVSHEGSVAAQSEEGSSKNCQTHPHHHFQARRYGLRPSDQIG